MRKASKMCATKTMWSMERTIAEFLMKTERLEKENDVLKQLVYKETKKTND